MPIGVERSELNLWHRPRGEILANSLLIIAIVILVFGLVALGGTAAIGATIAANVSSVFRTIAGTLDGSVSVAGNRQTLFFKQRGVPFQAKVVYRSGKSFLQLTAPIGTGKFRLKLFEDLIAPKQKQFLGMQDILIGSPEFDDRYIIQSNSTEELFRILTPEAQQAILNLGRTIELNILRGQFTAQMLAGTQRADLERRINEGVAAYFALSDAVYGPVENVISNVALVETEEALCMVCGEQIDSNRVDCRSCKTAHHKDCWEYLGMCSTYACGHKQYSLPGKKNPIDLFRIRR